jgi:hypothetical protein
LVHVFWKKAVKEKIFCGQRIYESVVFDFFLAVEKKLNWKKNSKNKFIHFFHFFLSIVEKSETKKE